MSKLTIIEVLDFGQSLLSDGTILKSDGTIITKEQYEEAQVSALKNKLDWYSVEVDEFLGYMDTAIYATRTYAISEEVSGMSTSKMGFTILDSEGEPFYLRSQEFSGSEKYEIASATYNKVIYNVNKNSTEEAFDALVIALEEHFNTTDMLGSMFQSDEGDDIKIKKSIKDNHVWNLAFKNNILFSVKKKDRLVRQMEAQPKPSKLSEAMNTDRFANMH